ncbi:RDD family protein [Agrococcus sp. SGAir0287]|uniref:RDD family protein n=1 Tax=Agrococcus sp. SGAir0287 TaxID=2070347 RepID=UPI0010CCFC24|nr:RDD family protein [Agrococcus sp. SGAir0287]QCR18200.1 hypothetical protein C1N71_01020 [Agrococcus sp. SGAir0287]
MSEHRSVGHDGIPRAPEPLIHPLGERDRSVTPDGVPLSGWWRRLFACLLDALLIGVAASIVTVPLQIARPDVWLGTVQSGRVLDMLVTLDARLIVGQLVTAALLLVIGGAYSILMTSRLGWTLGKRALGIRVRHRDRERLPTLGEAAARWAVALAPGALGQVPSVAGITNLWTMVDGLWPIWDRRRQAIHDKVARTNVVLA